MPELQFNDEAKTREQLLSDIAALRRENARLQTLAAHQQETEQTLRGSESRFGQVIGAISDHIYVTEVTQEGDYLNRYLSPHIEDLTGYSSERFLNNWSFWPSQVIHPEDRGLAASHTSKLAMGQDTEVEYRLIRADGRIIWVRDRGRVQSDSQRTTSNIIYGVVSDITERKRLEERLVAIYQLGQELHLLRDEKTILKQVLKTISRILQGESAGYHRDDEAAEDTAHFQVLFPKATDKVGLRLLLDQTGDVISVVVHHGQPHTIGSINGLPMASDRPHHSQLSVPMKVGERVIGVMNIESQEAQRFTPSDRQLLQILANQTAISIENSRLYNETRQRVEELAAMSMIGQAIISTLDLQETLTVVTDHAIRLLDVGTAAIALYDAQRADLWFAAASGDGADLIRGRRLPVDEGVVGWVVQHGEPALIPDVSQAANFFDTPDLADETQLGSVLSVPLQTGTQTIGAIELRNKKKRPFDQKDMRLLGWLAMPAATAIENARLYEEQRRAREQAETLREATSTLTSTLNLNHLLDNILIHLEQVIPYNNACVFLRESMWLNVVAGRGTTFVQPRDPHQLRRPANDPLYQQIQTTGRPLVLSNIKTESRFRDVGDTASMRAWMGVPLMVRRQVIGYLTLDSRRVGAYGQTEAHLAQAFANQAAVAIQNARLFAEVRNGHKRLQSLSRRLVNRQETERRHIARELHDEAGQALTTLRVGLHLLEQEADDPQAVVSRVTNLKRLTESVLENLHRLAMDLRPASLEHLGLVAALEQLIETFAQQHFLVLQLETLNMNEKRLSLTVETSLYRIVQEALTNVVRHAQASRADVFLKRRDAQIIMIIEDDGVGFDAGDSGYSSRLGLVGMRERAEMLGGQLVIESEIGSGTTVYVEVPYDNSDSHR